MLVIKLFWITQQSSILEYLNVDGGVNYLEIFNSGSFVRNISQMFWISVKLQQQLLKNSRQKLQKQANKDQKRWQWILILNELQPSSKFL